MYFLPVVQFLGCAYAHVPSFVKIGPFLVNFGEFDLNDLDLDVDLDRWRMGLRNGNSGVGLCPCAEFRENLTVFGQFDL